MMGKPKGLDLLLPPSPGQPVQERVTGFPTSGLVLHLCAVMQQRHTTMRRYHDKRPWMPTLFLPYGVLLYFGFLLSQASLAFSRGQTASSSRLIRNTQLCPCHANDLGAARFSMRVTLYRTFYGRSL